MGQGRKEFEQALDKVLELEDGWHSSFGQKVDTGIGVSEIVKCNVDIFRDIINNEIDIMDGYYPYVCMMIDGSVSFDFDDGIFVYDIEFVSNGDLNAEVKFMSSVDDTVTSLFVGFEFVDKSSILDALNMFNKFSKRCRENGLVGYIGLYKGYP